MDAFNGFLYHYSTDINGLAVSSDPQVPQTYQPAFDPPTAGRSGLLFGLQLFPSTHYSSLVMQYHHQPRSHPANQGPSGIVRTQQPLERTPPTYSQPPNPQIHTSPTGIWNPSIAAQVLPAGATPSYETPATQ
jgi:hypothetical protein